METLTYLVTNIWDRLRKRQIENREFNDTDVNFILDQLLLIWLLFNRKLFLEIINFMGKCSHMKFLDRLVIRLELEFLGSFQSL